jgi:CxxC motif-containing protein (DUF1111 family)
MRRHALVLPLALALVLGASQAPGQFIAHDPGVRGGPPGAGGMLAGLTPAQQAAFDAGLEEFSEQEGVGDGLGPRFNLDSCAGCHTQPAIGGTSPAINPQVAVATAFGARNTLPAFIRPNGPVREVRFKYKPDGSRDGGVHGLFVISGRVDPTGDATGCTITQDDFDGNFARGNAIFRIPTPTFGAGLIEMIPDYVIVANQRAGVTLKSSLGIGGRPHFILPSGNANRNGNDGTVARFGWKAQNKSLLLFAGEAYNVEQGISNELFQTEREEDLNCQFAPVPNDTTNLDGTSAPDVLSGIQKFAFFMKFLAPPTPSPDTPGGSASIARGRLLFAITGCALCHTPSLTTGPSVTPAFDRQPVNLFSDVLLHNMGAGLADDILQGAAGPDEFRTAPLWGLGQRIFFLHDGRTSDLVVAINAHRSAATTRYRASEANLVVDRFRALGEAQKQDLLNFLRSL